MPHFLDSVPFSGIIRIRDMMYAVERPFRLDQGDVSFDAPDSVKQGDGQGHRRQPLALPADGRRTAAPGAARREAARKNGIPVGSPDEVLVTNGGIHALYILFQALLEPGDEVVIPDPLWPPGAGTILSARGVVVRYPLHEAAGWRFDIDELAALPDAEDARHLRQLAAEPDRRRAHARGRRGDRAAGRRARAVADLRRGVRGRGVRRRARVGRVAPGHVPPHGAGLHLQQVVRDDRAAARLPGGVGRGAEGPGDARRCSSRRATSRRSCSTAASRGLEGSQAVIEQFRAELQARRDLFYRGHRVARRRVQRASAARRVLRVPEVRPGVEEAGEPPTLATASARGVGAAAGTSSPSWDLTAFLIAAGRIGCVPGVDFGPGGEGYLRFCFARDRAELTGAIESMRSIFRQP